MESVNSKSDNPDDKISNTKVDEIKVSNTKINESKTEKTETAAISASVPQHIAIIMDGNGRWATRQGRPRSDGHFEGAKTVSKIIDAAIDRGVKQLTLYCLSSENWKRPEPELLFLMQLLRQYLTTEQERMIENDIRFSVIGERSRLPEDVVRQIELTTEKTKGGTRFHLCLAINYGSRREILESAKQLMRKTIAETLFSVQNQSDNSIRLDRSSNFDDSNNLNNLNNLDNLNHPNHSNILSNSDNIDSLDNSNNIDNSNILDSSNNLDSLSHPNYSNILSNSDNIDSLDNSKNIDNLNILDSSNNIDSLSHQNNSDILSNLDNIDSLNNPENINKSSISDNIVNSNISDNIESLENIENPLSDKALELTPSEFCLNRFLDELSRRTDALTETDFSNALYTAGMPDPDLLIRTAGELRLSNYLLWQLSYAEIWVTETCWPDFSVDEFNQAVDSFARRERRFGGLNS